MRCRIVYCICSLLFGIVGALLMLAALLLWAEFDTIYGETVRSQMSIDNQSLNWWFDKWYTPPVKHSLTIHIFELENVAEWRRSPADTKPLMREIGPFVFRVQKFKEKWNFTDAGHHQVWYNERTSYHFDELLSYQNLDKRAIVANAEMMAIAPFVNSLIKRISSTSRISRSLNNTVTQILSIYRSNMFVERTIERIIFGPETLTVNLVEESPFDSETIENEREDDIPMNSLNARQEIENGNSTKNEYSWVLDLLRDNATIRILNLYERSEQYFQRLGIVLNPFELVASQFDKAQIISTEGSFRLRANSILSLYQNNSLERFDLWTGKDQPGRQARLMRWNNQSKLQVWSGKQCNEINGTDGRQYSPFLKRRRIYLFENRICRSIPFSFSSPMSTPQGLDIHRYNRSLDFLLSPTKAPPNSCFCRYSAYSNQKRKSRPLLNDNSKKCNYDGILDLGTCYSGYGDASGYNDSVINSGAIPLMLTAVHFSGPFTKSISKEVRGIVPDQQLYKSVLDIEPVSGIVLHRTVKYQFNLHFIPTPVGNNQSTREMVIPLLWQDEQFTVNANYLSSIKYMFVYPFKYREFAMLGTAALGAGSSLVATFILCCCCCSKSKDNQKEVLIDEPIKKGSGKFSGKVTPIDDNNNKQAVAWNRNNFKHQQTEDDEFPFAGDEDEEYKEEDEVYDPNAMISSNKRIMGGNGNDNGGNRYPLERLKKDMPARQSATNQVPNNSRKQIPNNSNNANNGNPNNSLDSYGNAEYYKTRYDGNSYDVFGDDHFANPSNGRQTTGHHMPLPPPPPPPQPSFGLPTVNNNHTNGIPHTAAGADKDRESLLRQIRAGTQLRHTGDSLNDAMLFERQMAMTSMFIIQQLLTQQHEQVRWQHVQTTQDALAAQMMRQLMPYVSLSLPQINAPSYLPAYHHEEVEALLFAPNQNNLQTSIALPSIESDPEYASRIRSIASESTNSTNQTLSQFEDDLSQTRIRRAIPSGLSIEMNDSSIMNSSEYERQNIVQQSNEIPSENEALKNSGKGEAIRFYGPYRAYNSSKINEKDTTSNLSFANEDDDWDSDFDDDDDNNNNSLTNSNILNDHPRRQGKKTPG